MEFKHYPEIDDEDFYKRIYLKKEFYKTKVDMKAFEKKSIEDFCKPSQFELSSYQEFVRNFISSTTGYNSLLAFWGVGVGKTCAAIQIAEGLKPELRKLGKKIYIIAKEQIVPNFKRELYNFDKESRESIPGSSQCTGSSYYISRAEQPDEKLRKRDIQKLYKETYVFNGMRKFANYVDMTVKPKGPNAIREEFENCVFIIDEAQGLTGENKNLDRADRKKKNDNEESDVENSEDEISSEEEEDSDENDDDDNSKSKKTQSTKTKSSKSQKGHMKGNMKGNMKQKVTTRGILMVLHDIIEQCQGTTKFVMLTATPMKDNENELIDILSIMLHNDGRPEYKLEKSTIFSEIYENGVNEDELRRLTKGYVSYVRGENPKIFPTVIDVDKKFLDKLGLEMYLPHPQFDELGEPIDPSEYIKYTELVKCHMSDFQYSNYRKIINDTIHQEGIQSHTIDQKGRIAGNVIFPNGYSGNEAFNRIFQKTKTGGKSTGITTKGGNKLAQKTHTSFKIESPENADFLLLDNLWQYSTKLYHFLNILFNGNYRSGVSFIFSNFVAVGAKLIALALEQNGYDRYQPPKATHSINLLKLSTPLQDSQKRCICGKIKSNDIHSSENSISGRGHNFVQAQYALFTGDQEKYRDECISAINASNNQYGEEVKVIIGTSTVAEGIDFKRIRSVHIFDPWHNETRLHQVIGRAVRHCSHMDLPKENQNVTIYKYSATAPDPKTTRIRNEMNLETSDEKIYRRIERKDLIVKRVERILKEVAVDCQLNKALNLYGLDGRDNTRQCDYTDCNYTCAGNLDKVDEDIESGREEIDTDTYNLHFSEPHIAKAELIIYELFRFNFVIDLNNLIHLVQRVEPNLDHKYIYEAIERVIGKDPKIKPKKIVDRFGRSGYIIYGNPVKTTLFDDNGKQISPSYYIFQPDDISDVRAPLYYREVPVTIKTSNIVLDHNTAPDIIVDKTSTDIEPLTEKEYGQYISNLLSISQERVDYFVDRITFQKRIEFFEKYIERNVDSFDYDDENNITGSNLLINDKILLSFYRYVEHVFLGSSRNNRVFGHKMGGKARLFNGNDDSNMKWIDCDEKKNQLYLAMEMQKPSHREIGSTAPIHGFFMEKGNKESVFKIINRNTESVQIKRTDRQKGNEVKSKRSQQTGHVCSTLAASAIIEFAESLNIDLVSGASRKTSCENIELELRRLQNNIYVNGDLGTPDQRLFYSHMEWNNF